jgi:hypothetical protein
MSKLIVPHANEREKAIFEKFNIKGRIERWKN